MIRIALGMCLALGVAGPASAQTLQLMKGIDAPHYDAHLWMPVLNINMDHVANKKITDAKPHMIYQNTFYKGLDVSRQK